MCAPMSVSSCVYMEATHLEVRLGNRHYCVPVLLESVVPPLSFSLHLQGHSFSILLECTTEVAWDGFRAHGCHTFSTHQQVHGCRREHTLTPSSCTVLRKTV